MTFLDEHVTEIVVAFFALLGIIASNWDTIRSKNKEVVRAKLECDFQARTLGFNQFIDQWGKFLPELEALMATTNIDRFLILCAWNGSDDPKFTTAIYQYHKTGDAIRQYINFEIDTHYQHLLREVQINGVSRIKTADLPKCVLRSVYEDERVTEADMFFLSYDKLKGSESAAITYCSFATHDNVPVSESTHLGCHRVVSMLKGLANNYVHM